MKLSLTLMGMIALALPMISCTEADGESKAEALVSPDGTRVAYADRYSEWFQALHVSNVDGSDPVVLYRDSGVILPVEWTPDGRQILARIRWPGRPGQPEVFLLVSIDGSVRMIPEP
jgi:hypothetical protein